MVNIKKHNLNNKWFSTSPGITRGVPSTGMTMGLRQGWPWAFTLIEMLVAITILSIIMISIISIFILSSDLSLKIDINRSMQNNVKSLVESIAEDVRKNWIAWLSKDLLDPCSRNLWTNKYKEWTKLCTLNNEYFLAKKNSTWTWWIRVNDTETDCSEIKSHCVMVVKKPNKDTPSIKEISPLTNSFVSFRDLSFSISDKYIDKVVINFTVQPATSKWIKSDLIKENKIVFQTTLSQRLIETK